MSDREVKRLTPNSIANLVMADEAWHDSLYVKAEDYDSLLADFEALRTHLAAEQPKPEPVAYFDLQKQVFFWAKPTQIDVPMTIALEPLPLFTAPPEDEAMRRDAERYRWLREKDGIAVDVTVFGSMEANLDAAVDAAMGDKT